jgi:hypothetical protein
MRITPAFPKGVLRVPRLKVSLTTLTSRSRVTGVQSNRSRFVTGRARARVPVSISCSNGLPSACPSRPTMKTRRRFWGKP